MKFNRLPLVVAVLAGLCLHPWNVAAQTSGTTGAIGGAIELPPANVKARSFRGSLYRNRLAPDRGSPPQQQARRSPYDDVVISAHPLDFAAPMATTVAPAHMDQQSAQFEPRVLPVRAGATVEFVNRDRFYHNVFSLSKKNAFDIGRRPTGVVVEHVFENSGEVEVFCDIHPQMKATVLVLDTPWFTQPDSLGRFRLDRLPAGRYQLQAYHPEHGHLTREIDVGAGVPVMQNFLFGR